MKYIKVGIFVSLLYMAALQCMDQEQNQAFLRELNNCNVQRCQENKVSSLKNLCIKKIVADDLLQPLEVTKVVPLSLANSIVENKAYQSLNKCNDFNRSILKKFCKVGQSNVFSVCTAYYQGNWCILYSTSDGKIKIVDFFGKKVARIKHYDYQLSINSLCTITAHDTLYIILGCDDGSIRIFDLDKNKEVARCIGHTDEVYSVCTECIEGTWYIVSGSHDATVRIWDFILQSNEEGVVHCKQIAHCIGHADTVSSLCTVCVEGKRYIVSGSDDKTIRIWDFTIVQSGEKIVQCKELAQCVGHTDSVNSVYIACIQGIWYIISGSDDKTIRMWDFQGHEVRKYTDEERIGFAGVVCIESEPYIVSYSSKSTINVYDFQGNKILNYDERGNDFNAVSIASIDGEWYILVAALFSVSVYDFFSMIRKIKTLSYGGCEKVLALLKNGDHGTVAKRQKLYEQLKSIEDGDNQNNENNKKRKFDQLN